MSRDSEARAPRTSRTTPAPGKARARACVSLKMQAIGFLSRREHSRQELRAKLLDSLRKRAREEAALAAAAAQAAQELDNALREQPSNGIDDAFAPPLAARLSASASVASSVSAGLAARAFDGPAGSTNAARDARPGDVSRASGGAPESDAKLASRNAPRVHAFPKTDEPARDAWADGAAAASPDSTESAQGNDMKSRAVLATLRLANGAALPSHLLATLSVASQSENSPGVVPAPMAGHQAADFGRAEPGPVDPDAIAGLELTDPEAAVDQLLDWLVANKYLSEERFVESRVNARLHKQGTLLIKLELSRYGLALEPEQAAQLRETEFARAQALWQRKFGKVAPDARLRARQARFLAARGFAADVVRRVVGGEEEF